MALQEDRPHPVCFGQHRSGGRSAEGSRSGRLSAIPHRRNLDLGKPLAISFVDTELPDHAAQVRDFFRRKGAYGHFKHLLQTADVLDKWYAFEEQATRDAIRRWCEEAGVTIVENEKHG